MSAEIVVIEGPQPGREFAVEEELVRVGSSPDCPICLDGLPPHALTVEFRDGRYRVYNRCAAPVRVGSKQLVSGQSLPWNDGQTVRIDAANLLRLSVDRGPRPAARRPEVKLPESVMTQIDPGAENPPAANRARQAVIIAGGLLLMGFFFLRSGSGGAGPARVDEQFSLIVAAIFEHAPEDIRAARIRALLQEARALEHQGRAAKAVAKYRLAQKWASAKRRQDDPLFSRRDIANIERMARDFAGWRLERLSN